MKYTAEQLRAIESEARYLCVDAGAGSGKTRVLVDRIVHLLRTDKAKLEEIVAITFTEKAALEMKERLRRAFRKAAPKDDPEQFSFWRDLERRVDTAQITTIHAFCSRLLRENALYLDLDPDFGMLSDAESALMMHEVIEREMLGAIDRNAGFMTRLAAEFPLYQLHGLCRTLLLNRGVVDRIRREHDVSSADAIREDWHATAEAEESRYLEAMGRSAEVTTLLLALRSYDGLCDDPTEGREQWRNAMVDGFEAMQAGLARDAVLATLEGFVKNPFGNGKKKLWPSEAVYKAISNLQDKVRDFAKAVLAGEEENSDMTAHAAQLTCDLLALDDLVAAAFAQAKRDASLLDFDDLVLLVLQVLRDSDGLRTRTASRIRYLLLDEFQDTDGQQLEIAQLLHQAPGGPDLFIVGDPKQSIYYFRGADVSIFQQERAVAEEVVELDQNFRSLPGVLGFANDFFARSNLLCAVEQYHPMQIHRAPDGAARTGFILTDAPDNEKWNASDYRAAEAAQIAAQIQRLCAPDATATVFDEQTGAERRADYGDIALLFRATSNVGLYEEALRKAGIPYVVVAGKGFYERQEVVDVINVLKILADPWDEHALLGYLRGPIVALPDDDIVRLCGAGGLAEVALGEGMPEGLAYPERLERARDLYRQLRARLASPLSELVDHLLAVTGVEAILLSQFLGLQKASNVRKLAAVAREQASRGNLTLRQFVRYLDDVHLHAIREGEAGLQPDGTGAVTIMTIHKSKGLEFPVVFIPDMAPAAGGNKEHTLRMHRALGLALILTEDEGDRNDTRLGRYIKRRIKEEEDAESARLLYVALTRARDLLYLCGQSDARIGSWFHAFDAIYRVADRDHGEVIDGKGWKAEVLRAIPDVAPSKSAAAAVTEVDVERTRRRVAPVAAPERAANTISVSRLLTLLVPDSFEGETPQEDGQPRVERDNTYAMDRGTLVHRMFELWDFAGDAPDVGALIRAAQLGLRHREKLQSDLERIRDWFAVSALGERLKGEQGLLREHPFTLRIGETLVNGTIDLALADGTLVDYKTGKVKASTSARYEKQLLLYAAAMRELTGVAPAMGMLVYVDAGEVVEVGLDGARVDGVLRESLQFLH